MGKHLTIEEKVNAVELKAELEKKIKDMRAEIKGLMYKKHRLTEYIRYSKTSKYAGKYFRETFCYKKFGKQWNELSEKERHIFYKEQKKIYMEKHKEKFGG